MRDDLSTALSYHQQGFLEQAARIYQVLLDRNPKYVDALHLLGVVALQRGNPARAVELISRAIALKPAVASYHSNLGEAYRALGQLQRVVDCCRMALLLEPNFPEAANNLGAALLALGQKEAAVEQFRAALRLQPGYAEAQNNLGNALRELGQLAEAKACYAEALRLNPGLAMIYNNLGQVFQEESKLAEALTWYQHGLQRDPNSARIHCNMASALGELERHEEAIAHYELALRLDPNYAQAYCGLGWVRHELGRFQEALALYQQALRLKPDLAAAHDCLGTVLKELNDFEAAQRQLRETLRLDPSHAGALAQLAALLRGKLPEADLAAMRQLVADPALSVSKRSALHFGLALVLDAQGAYDEAAEHLRQANSLRLAEWRTQGKDYDPAAHARFVEGLMATCTPDFFERVRGFGLETERPIFIVGLPRSGTTLTEQILASHSQVFGAGELRLAGETFKSLPAAMNSEAPALECLGRLDRETDRRLADRHLERLRELDEQALRVADKMPDSYLYLGLLATLFPRGKFIHCRRDLHDIAVSCWMTNFRRIHWTCDSEHIASRFREYRRLMEHWRQVLPVRVLEVDYEETVEDLEGVARRLVAWCGLEWEPACMAFHEGNRPVRTASVTQVRQPIYKHAVARWKHYEQALAPLLTQLGCDPKKR